VVLEKTLSVLPMQQSQPTHQEEGVQQQQKPANPPQQDTTTLGQRLKFVLQKRKTMHNRNSPNAPKNTAQERSKKQLSTFINNLQRKQMIL